MNLRLCHTGRVGNPISAVLALGAMVGSVWVFGLSLSRRLFIQNISFAWVSSLEFESKNKMTCLSPNVEHITMKTRCRPGDWPRRHKVDIHRVIPAPQAALHFSRASYDKGRINRLLRPDSPISYSI
jgi:hypothetical protein